jgi:hypothetical protein
VVPFLSETCTTWTMTVPGLLVDEGHDDQVWLATAFTAELDFTMGMEEEEDPPYPPSP